MLNGYTRNRKRKKVKRHPPNQFKKWKKKHRRGIERLGTHLFVAAVAALAILFILWDYYNW